MDKKNKFFLVICFISALVIGTILPALLVIIGPIFSYLSIYMAIFILIILSFLTYFSFSSFDLKENTILFQTLPISIVISIMTFIINSPYRSFLQALQEQAAMESSANNVIALGYISPITSLFNINEMLNIWLLVTLIIVIYNLPSVIFMLSKKEVPNSQ